MINISIYLSSVISKVFCRVHTFIRAMIRTESEYQGALHMKTFWSEIKHVGKIKKVEQFMWHIYYIIIFYTLKAVQFNVASSISILDYLLTTSSPCLFSPLWLCARVNLWWINYRLQFHFVQEHSQKIIVGPHQEYMNSVYPGFLLVKLTSFHTAVNMGLKCSASDKDVCTLRVCSFMLYVAWYFSRLIANRTCLDRLFW